MACLKSWQRKTIIIIIVILYSLKPNLKKLCLLLIPTVYFTVPPPLLKSLIAKYLEHVTQHIITKHITQNLSNQNRTYPTIKHIKIQISINKTYQKPNNQIETSRKHIKIKLIELKLIFNYR